MSIAGPPLWDKSTGEWKGIIPNVWGGGTLVLKDPKTIEQDTVKFWTIYSNDIADKMKKAVNAKGEWVASGKCTGKYAISCVTDLWVASCAFVEALNKINNHDTISQCCKTQTNGGRGDDGDTSGIDLLTYVRALQLASNLSSVDPADGADTLGPTEQDPNVQPPDI